MHRGKSIICQLQPDNLSACEIIAHVSELPSQTTAGASQQELIFGCLLITVVSLLLYSQAVQFDYLNWDDPLYVTENRVVQEGLTLQGLTWAFTEFRVVNWHPVTWLSHMADVSMFGMDPAGHHASSLVIHAINASLVFVFLMKATGRMPPALFAALLFAVHPTHVESVAWISERKDLLSTFFLLLAMIVYISSIAWRPRMILVFICLTLGLMSKAMLVSAPLLLILLDIWPRQTISLQGPIRAWRGIKGSLVEKVPIFILVVVFSILTMLAQSSAVSGNVPFEVRVGNALVSYGAYLAKLFYATDLTAFYPHPGQWPVAQVLVSGLLLVIISLIAIATLRTRPYLFAGWFFFLIALGPVIGLVQVGLQSHADRYLYIPSIGLFAAFAWLYRDLTARANRVLRLLAPLILLSVFSFQTWQYLPNWKNSVSVWWNVLAVNDSRYVSFLEGDSPVMALNEVPMGLMIAYANMANALEQAGLLEDAVMHFDIAVSINPADTGLRRRYAQTLFYGGRPEEAEVQLLQALHHGSTDPQVAAMLEAVREIRKETD
jgi:hypothetical protein